VTYVLWGLYFFLLLLGEKAFPVKGKRGILPLRRLVTFFLVYFGWIIFAAKDAVALYQTVIRMLSFDLGGLGPTLLVIRNNLPLLLVGILLAVPGPIWAERFRNWNRTLSLPGRKTVAVAQTFFLILIFALCTVVLLGTAAKPSMYAGF
jgi:alginate O-acetyltransferase complex protein AlgI